MSLRDARARSDNCSELGPVPALSRRIASVLLLLVTASCRDQPTQSAEPTVVPALVSMEGAAENDERIAAMMSIHAYARWTDPNSMRGLHVMPLTKAAQFLAADESPFAGSRRRRAIAKLGGYRYHADKLAPDSEAVRALTILAPPTPGAPTPGATPIASLPDYIRQQLTLYTKVQASDNPPSAPELESLTFSLPPFAALAAQGCPIPEFKVTPSGGGLDAEATVNLTVGRGICAVSAALDPQSWDVCSKFFKRPPERTYLAHLRNETPVSEPTLPPGSAYGGTPVKMIFEHYSCPKTDSNGNPTGCDATLENMLRITTIWKSTTPGNRRYFMSYSLDQPDGALNGTILGEQAQLLVDQGDVDVKETSNTSVTVTGTKQVTFGNPVLNGFDQAVFEVFADELAGEFAELSCCAGVAAYVGAPCDVTPTP